ncbi:uncharacterized protein Triagg1_8232 [Trichoderma aggressivum f. europaeum]|uniref:Peptidase metallopeptidase domain-containing protein n=1 Tax=Trichoderma aggressivum f. europaeum TaxID=173218 RepID=A0AAE1IAJ0_9HYPO|nr:hypothetical protein Triagg1_8232 [Trichoderma aggressivum f. europaeum]
MISKPFLKEKTIATPLGMEIIFLCMLRVKFAVSVASCANEMLVISGHATSIYASAQSFATGIGDDVLHPRISLSSSERGRDILTSFDDHDVASINMMSFTAPDNENGNVGEIKYRRYTETLGPISNSDRLTSSVRSDMTSRHDPESQIKKGRDQERDLSTSTETGVAAPATFLRRTVVPLHTAVSKYRCVTETYGYTEVRVGQGDHISRWLRDSKLTYTVDVESFPTLAEGMQVKAAMREAISMWRGIGASFEDLGVDNIGSATFVVRYDSRRCSKTYASSFFPDQVPGELCVFNLALSNAPHLANILAHENGHILGLRHEFADEHHKEGRNLPCVLIGKKNSRSIMNYYEDPGQLQVTEQDLRGLKELYECNDETYKGLPIHDYDPISRQRVSREETRCSHAMRKPSRKFLGRSALRKLDSFIYATFHDAKRATIQRT